VLLLLTNAIFSKQEPIAEYEPRSQITDYAAIDMDQKAIQERAGLADFNRALRVYQEGGHSGSYARVTLLNPRENLKYAMGTGVAGTAERGFEVFAELLDDIEWASPDSVQVNIKYSVSDEQSHHVDCMVGALYTFEGGYRNGCKFVFNQETLKSNKCPGFNASGILQIAPLTDPQSIADFKYVYDNRRDNLNYRTIQKFSIDAVNLMNMCQGSSQPCYFDDYQQFVDYYGDYDYGDKWVMAAGNGENTEFSNNRGDANFAELVGTGGGGRVESLTHGTWLLNIYMMIIRQMELAVKACKEECNGVAKCSPGINQWDRAVAYYTGSLQGQTGDGEGVLHYELADSRSREFKTSGYLTNEVRGTAYVNLEAIHLFSISQTKLTQDSEGRCSEIEHNKNRITNLMKVPVVQSVLRYAYLRQYDDEYQERHIAKGATFSTALLPYLHACSETDAKRLYNYMHIGSEDRNVEYDEIKALLEKNYGCLGITCAQVGGFFKGGEYRQGSVPCTDEIEVIDRTPASSRPIASDQSSSSNEVNSGSDGTSRVEVFLIILIVLASLLLCGLCLLKFTRKEKRKDHDFDAHGEKNLAAVTAVTEAELA